MQSSFIVQLLVIGTSEVSYTFDMPTEHFSRTTGYAGIHSHFHLGESAAIYLGHTFRQFAVSLIGIFLPIYIFILPNLPIISSNAITNSIIWVFLYYAIEAATNFVTTAALANVVFQKIKFKGAIGLSSVLLSVGFLCLSLVPINFNLLYLAGILLGAQIFFYWTPYHILFMRKMKTNKGHYGSNIATRVFLSKLARMAGPLLGGVFIASYGFQIVFYIGIIILMLSSIPIVLAVSEHKHEKHNVFAVLRSRKLLKTTAAIASIETETKLYSILWPILLFLGLSSFTKIGYITSFSLLISSFVTIYAGKMIDKHGEKKIMKIGAPLVSLSYIPRAFSLIPPILYGIDILDRATSTIYPMPYMAKVYEIARKTKHESDFILHREIVQRAAYLLLLIIILPIIYFTHSWQWIFIGMAAFPFITLLITKEK